MSLRSARGSVDRLLERALAGLLAAMVVNVLWQVLARFILGDPSSWTEELARFGLIWLGLLGAAYGFGRRAHLAIDLLPAGLGRRGPRARAALEVVIQACTGVFALAVLGVGGAALVQLTWSLEQTSAALGVRLGAVYSVLPISGAIIAFYAICAVAEVVSADGVADEAPGAGEVG